MPEADLEAEALALAATLATRPPEALTIARDLMLGDRDTLVARIEEEGHHFRARLKSDEAREAFMAFMGRKKGQGRRFRALARIVEAVRKRLDSDGGRAKG